MLAESTSLGLDNAPEMPDTLLKLSSSPSTQDQDCPGDNPTLFQKFKGISD